MRIAIVVILLIMLAMPIMAQVVAPPTDVDNAVLQKIDQDGKVTRQYFSQEMTRQNDAFLKEIDKRTIFYEKEFFDTLNNLILKLSMFWGAVIFFVVGLSNMLRMTLESKRFKRMKQTLKDELKEELSQNYTPKGTAKGKSILEKHDMDAVMHSRPLVIDEPKKKLWFVKKEKKPTEIELLRQQNELLKKQMESLMKPEPKIEVY